MNEQPFKCPICEGKGIVPGGFYTATGETWTSDRTTEICRACSGTGLVWGEDDSNEEYFFDGSKYIPATFTINPPLNTPDVIIK